MSERKTMQPMVPVLLGIITFMVVVAGLRTAQAIVVPVLLAVFAALVASPALLWSQRKGIPTWLAVVAIVLVIVGFVGLVGYIAGASVQDFSDRLPAYKQQLWQRLEEGSEGLGERAGTLVRDMFNLFDPGKAMGLAAALLNGLGAALTNAALIVFILIFLLFEVSHFPAKLRLAIPGSQAVLHYISEVAHSVKRYLAVKTLVSLATGLAVGLMVWALGVDFPLLWGLLAFLLNYVPNIGSILAAVPTVMLALIQWGLFRALLVGAGYVLINLILGNLIEPRLAGARVGLSTLVVFLSLVFWGWVLGPVGMLLAVPLTATIKIALAGSPSTRWAAILLGGTPQTPQPAEPP